MKIMQIQNDDPRALQLLGAVCKLASSASIANAELEAMIPNSPMKQIFIEKATGPGKTKILQMVGYITMHVIGPETIQALAKPLLVECEKSGMDPVPFMNKQVAEYIINQGEPHATT